MENIQFIIKDYQISKLGIGNILKCLISALSVNEDTVIECYPEYTYGAYDTILDKRFIYQGESRKEQEKVYTCRFLILKEEAEHQKDLPMEEWYIGGLENPRFHHFFSFDTRIDWQYDASQLSPLVMNRIFSVMDRIRFTDMIYHEVQRLSGWDHALGISVRTWKSSHETGIDRPYEFDWYRDRIRQVRQEHPEIQTVVLSIDHPAFLEPYLSLFDIPVVVLEKEPHWNPIQYALIKALVLSKCSYFIGNRISTFTELVFWFGRCKPQVYTVG